MTLETIHSIEKGIRRLMGAPVDLYPGLPDQGLARPLTEASDAHRRLYGEYIADFSTAYDVADAWWEDSVEAFISDGYSKAEAIDLAFDKRLAGPASSPEVVWFFRAYWLSFDEVNRRLPPPDRVPPQVCMLGWLVEEDRKDYIRLLTCMPYWPMGLDENGNWT